MKSKSNTVQSFDSRNDYRSRPESSNTSHQHNQHNQHKNSNSSLHFLQQPLSKSNKKPMVFLLLYCIHARQSQKKNTVNMNHLLNFSFPSRQESTFSPLRRKKTLVPAYNKERFINAKYVFHLQVKFIVKIE